MTNIFIVYVLKDNEEVRNFSFHDRENKID